MKILLCNDDGHFALGINSLERALTEAGHHCTIVAPHQERSGQSHAVSFFNPVVVRRLSERVYSVHGTPADCAIIGIDLLKDSKPDLVISGINHGLNVGWDVNYSGTVGAATEATLLGYRAMAFSVDVFNKPDPKKSFEMCAAFAVKLVANAEKIEWPKFEVLNVNHPGHEPKGIVSADCNGVTLYAPALERLESKKNPFPDAAAYMIGGVERMTSEAPNQDVTLVQKGNITLSFIQSRQSTTAHSKKLQSFIESSL